MHGGADVCVLTNRYIWVRVGVQLVHACDSLRPPDTQTAP